MMDQFKTLQEFIVTWMDELWWSMRDRVGALSMIESLQNSWQAAGKKVGEIGKTEGLDIIKTAEAAHSMFGRTVDVNNHTIRVTTCPIWDRILAGQLEYALRCEDFICAPYLTGIKDALGAKEAKVETNLRLAYVTRAKLEYKLKKLKANGSTDSKAKVEITDLEKELEKLPKTPACIFKVK
ncbi:MAG: hypothetical protein ACFFBR_01490 [Promethearchaeota archaeon]